MEFSLEVIFYLGPVSLCPGTPHLSASSPETSGTLPGLELRSWGITPHESLRRGERGAVWRALAIEVGSSLPPVVKSDSAGRSAEVRC